MLDAGTTVNGTLRSPTLSDRPPDAPLPRGSSHCPDPARADFAMSSAGFIAFVIAAVLLGVIIALASESTFSGGDDSAVPRDPAGGFGSGYGEGQGPWSG